MVPSESASERRSVLQTWQCTGMQDVTNNKNIANYDDITQVTSVRRFSHRKALTLLSGSFRRKINKRCLLQRKMNNLGLMRPRVMKGCHDAEGHWELMVIDRYEEETLTCSLCLCSKSFHMCQWRQRFPDDSDIWWSSCAPSSAVGSMWRSVGCSLQCRPLPCCFKDRGCVHEVCMNTAHSAALCPRCTLQPAPLTPSGLRQTLALELPSRHFLLSENRQQKRSLTHTDRSTHPSTHPFKPGWVNAPPFPDYSQASSGMLVRQQVHQSSPTSGLSFRGVHSLFFLKTKPHWNFTVLKQFSCWWFKDILQKNKNS